MGRGTGPKLSYIDFGLFWEVHPAHLRGSCIYSPRRAPRRALRGARRQWPKALRSAGPRRVCRACQIPGCRFLQVLQVPTASATAARPPKSVPQKRPQNRTSKKVDFLDTPPQRTPKEIQTSSKSVSGGLLKGVLEKVSKK